MRIWSLHPRHLDRQGLVACWRETLLAQAVLAGRTRGYQHHPQLDRFRAAEAAGVGTVLDLVGAYLGALADEADRRGYRFDRARILEPAPQRARLTVTDGQLALEWDHLLAKLCARSPDDWERARDAEAAPHPLFDVVSGSVEAWERAVPASVSAAMDADAEA